jgi:hypothetical protein
MIGLLCFVVAALASSFKSKIMNVRNSRVEYGLRQLEQEVKMTSRPWTDTNFDSRGFPRYREA